MAVASAFYGVRTTGIVCRVGCASRAPLPQNLVLFDDLQQALDTGFRPCRRCRPEGEHPQLAFRAELVRQAAGLLRLGVPVREVAERLHVSDRHLRRLVHQEAGCAPRALAGR